MKYFKKNKSKSFLLYFMVSISNCFANSTETIKPKLKDFSFNVFSQFGEDGIIKKIFELIGTKTKLCIEFGASDGFYMSNTANLWIKEDWKAFLIEGDKESYKKLSANIRGYNCTIINTYVNITDQHIEKILRDNKINETVDLMSIDIDGNDYKIFESLTDLRPRIIICEYNPTIPITLDIYPKYKNNRLGCSLASLVRIASQKNYNLIAITDTNAFFVVHEEFFKFNQFETDIEKIKIIKWIKYFISNYDGDYFVIGENNIMPYGIAKPNKEDIIGNDSSKIFRIN